MKNKYRIDGFLLEPIYDCAKVKDQKEMDKYISRVSRFKSSLIIELLSKKDLCDLRVSSLNILTDSKETVAETSYSDLFDIEIITLNNLLYGHRNMFNYIFNIFDDRTKTILSLRSKGYTLADTGEEFGISRERVRQLESIAVKILTSFTDIILAHSVRSNSTIEVDIFEEDYSISERQLINFLIRVNKNVHYINEFDKYVYLNKDINKDYEVFLQDIIIRDYISSGFIERKFEEMNSEGIEYIDYDDISNYLIKKGYKRKEDVFVNQKKRYAPYLYVIKKYFPEGIYLQQLSITDDFIKLSNLVKKEFPDFILTDNQRALMARLSEHLASIDRSLFVYKEDLVYDSHKVNYIIKNIGNYSDGTIYFDELYSIFESELKSAGISNRYKLRSVLMKENDGNYEFTRDALFKKNTEFVDFGTMINDYLKEIGREVSLSELRNEFEHSSNERIFSAISTNNKIINWGHGFYRHEETVKINKDIKYSTYKIINKFNSQKFIRFSEVLDLFILSEDFNIIKQGNSPTINNIVEVYFSGLFHHNDGYLWLKDSYEHDDYARIVKYMNISPDEEIRLVSLRRFFNDKKLSHQVQVKYLNSIYENRMIKDDKGFYKESVTISDEEFTKLEEHLQASVYENGFTTPKKLLEAIDFIPEKFYWTKESLIHCIRKYLSGKFTYIPTSSNKLTSRFGLIVSGVDENDGYKFISEYLRSLSIDTISISDLTDLLVELGVINISIPMSLLQTEDFDEKNSIVSVK